MGSPGRSPSPGQSVPRRRLVLVLRTARPEVTLLDLLGHQVIEVEAAHGLSQIRTNPRPHLALPLPGKASDRSETCVSPALSRRYDERAAGRRAPAQRPLGRGKGGAALGPTGSPDRRPLLGHPQGPCENQASAGRLTWAGHFHIWLDSERFLEAQIGAPTPV